MFKKFLVSTMFLVVTLALFVNSEKIVSASETDFSQNEEDLSETIKEYESYHKKLMEYIIFEDGVYIYNQEKAEKNHLSKFDSMSVKHLVILKNEEINKGEKEVFDKAQEFNHGIQGSVAK